MGIPIEAQMQLSPPVFPSEYLNGETNEPHQGIYEQSSTQEHALGTLLEYPTTGRKFRYGRAGGVALAAAYMTQAETNTAALTDETQSTSGTSVEVGDREITVDITTGTGLAENELAGGFICVDTSTGAGDIYPIVASKLQSTDTLLDLRLESDIRTAWAATTVISIVKSPFWDVVVVPTTVAERVTGVPLIAVTINYWCWLQTAGPCPIYVDTGEALVLGQPAGYPGTPNVAGAIGDLEAVTDATWGIPRYIGAAGEVAIVDLTLE